MHLVFPNRNVYKQLDHNMHGNKETNESQKSLLAEKLLLLSLPELRLKWMLFVFNIYYSTYLLIFVILTY